MREKLDFVQTMKDWRRMCKYYSDESMKDGQHSCVEMCPLGHNTACGVLEDALDSDIEVTAKEVAKWAAGHPEPVYPTWGDWFAERGDLIKLWRNIRVCSEHGAGVIGFLYDTIPADIAHNLGIEPKNG